MSATLSQDQYLLLNELIAGRYGVDFPEHRRELLEIRLRPRLEALNLASFWDYYLHFRSDTNGEWQRVAQLVTNKETFFFRERRQIDCFLSEAVPALRPDGGTPRVLCAGCSSGEEPYSLSMLARPAALSIDAFDLDAERIAAARRGEYGPSSLRLLEPEQRDRYFEPCGESRWSLRQSWRGDVRFSWGNIVDVETFRGGGLYDAVFCRNVLIYFSPAALHQAVRNFAAVLRPGGLLFLGATESIIGLSDLFETVRLPATIAYRRAAR